MTAEQRRSYRRTSVYAFVVAFVLTATTAFPTLAVFVALTVAALMVGGAAVLNLMDAKCTCERIVAEEVPR